MTERQSGEHTGCTSCRKNAFRKAEDCMAKAVIYNSIVRKCEHEPLGEYISTTLPPNERIDDSSTDMQT